MRERLAEYTDLIDQALKIAEARLSQKYSGSDDAAPISGLEFIVKRLRERKAEAQSGTLKPSGGFFTVGLNRELLDWGEYDSPLFKAIESLEKFYREHF